LVLNKFENRATSWLQNKYSIESRDDVFIFVLCPCQALEVIEHEQKAQLVRELDGNIMRCVRDQNGNHVIQKCIESIPTKKIGFALSAFRGQVANLSMHPYGCRVIQV
jgi:hypothetical protein